MDGLFTGQKKHKKTLRRRVVAWVRSFVPVSKARMEREVAQLKSQHDHQVKVLRRQHRAAIEETELRVDALIERFASIEFIRRDADRYALMVEFTSRLTSSGPLAPYDMELIAERVAGQVRREIATSKFVQSAANIERQRIRSARRGF